MSDAPRPDGGPELDVDESRPTESLTRRRVVLGALVVAAAILVTVVSSGGPDDASSLRSERPPDTPVTTGTVAAREVPVGASARRSVRVTATTTTPGTPSSSDAPTPAARAPTTDATPIPVPTLAPPDVAAPPAVVARPIPSGPQAAPSTAPAWPSTLTAGGYRGTDVGCAGGTSAAALDAFFRDRVGPAIGLDYQHVYDLGGDRRLWLFQDTFLDAGGDAQRLDQAAFVHNTAMLQRGECFTLLHRGSTAAPASFEPGTGERTLSTWFWPLGGDTSDGRLRMFWAEMAKTADPQPPDGLGWIPVGTWLATYDASTLARLDFRPAPDSGVEPIYGFAVSSDADHTYLFGNTFDQNLARQGGYHACPCSATTMSLARVPRGRLDVAPEYRTATGWSLDATEAEPFSTRFHAENPMQPRWLGGQWVAATKVDGYWGEELVIDVASEPWGPWTTVSRRVLSPRGGDAAMNTYHAHLMPWLSGGSLVVSVSQNARDMLRDAWPHPERYRPQFLAAALVAPPLEVPPTTPAPTTTLSSTTTIASTTTATTAPEAATSSSSTTPSTTVPAPVTTAPPPTEAPSTTACATSTTDAASTSSSSSTSSTAAPSCD